jgi:hypothetical protein
MYKRVGAIARVIAADVNIAQKMAPRMSTETLKGLSEIFPYFSSGKFLTQYFNPL